MLLQTNSYIVPKEKRSEHARLLQRFKQVMAKLGCDHFEVFEQVGANWSGAETGRFVQIMRFRDRQHVLAVQAAERGDAQAKEFIQEFCDLVNLPYQQQAGLFAAGYYNSVISLPWSPSARPNAAPRRAAIPVSGMGAAAATAGAVPESASGSVILPDASEADSDRDAAIPVDANAGDETPGDGTPGDPTLANPFNLDSGSTPTERAASSAGDTANGDIDILDYLDDVEPAGKQPPNDRLD